jgi:predicted O-methyltransferase YrrM
VRPVVDLHQPAAVPQGRELHRLAQLPEVRLVLEIGTWFGGGSSWCIAQGLGQGKWLITMEMFEEAWRYASETLRNMPVTCMRAGTVGVEHYLKPEQMTAEDRESEHYRLYYDRDIALAKPEDRKAHAERAVRRVRL